MHKHTVPSLPLTRLSGNVPTTYPVLGPRKSRSPYPHPVETCRSVGWIRRPVPKAREFHQGTAMGTVIAVPASRWKPAVP
jgi:hypothetical protein